MIRRPTRLPLIVLVLLAATPLFAQNPAVTVTVDAAADRRLIDPNIYGVAYATTAQLGDLLAPLNRRGGNNTSRYNWQENSDNRGSDWYFQSVPLGSAVPGESADIFFAETRAARAEPMLTFPMVGHVGKLEANRDKRASFLISKYGAQTGNDAQWFPDAGNGISATTGKYIVGNNPLDASIPSDTSFQAGWVQHLLNRWGSSGTGGLRYFILDNEPAIWHETHRDVHPDGQSMDELRDKVVAYGGRIKQMDPGALVAAPEEFGWSGYLLSGKDLKYGGECGWTNLPDRTAHGGADHLPWLLDQLRQEAATSGRRILDVFTVHYYPQGGEFGDDVSTAMQLRRNRSTRSLWDPSYVDETWINDVVRLLPRLKEWIAAYYPGTRIGITEYNFGAEGHINGATTQADVLGIFGREGLDLAARWTTPATSTPTYKAMKMYRNHDGTGSSFGDVSVRARAPNPDNLSSFAALRSGDGALTVMVVNKVLSGNTPLTVGVSNFVPGSAAQVWQLTQANVINRLTDIALSNGSLTTSLPAQSVTLFVFPSTAVPSLAVSDATVSEGDAGTRNVTFTVTLSPSGGAGLRRAVAAADAAAAQVAARAAAVTPAKPTSPRIPEPPSGRPLRVSAKISPEKVD